MLTLFCGRVPASGNGLVKLMHLLQIPIPSPYAITLVYQLLHLVFSLNILYLSSLIGNCYFPSVQTSTWSPAVADCYYLVCSTWSPAVADCYYLVYSAWSPAVANYYLLLFVTFMRYFSIYLIGWMLAIKPLF